MQFAVLVSVLQSTFMQLRVGVRASIKVVLVLIFEPLITRIRVRGGYFLRLHTPISLVGSAR